MWKRLLRFFRKAVRTRPARRKRASSRKGRRRPLPRRRMRRPAALKTARRPAKKRSQRKKSGRPRPRRRPRKSLPAPATRKRPAPKAVRPDALITHYFPKVRAAVLEVKRPLKIGDPVWIKGKATDFRQTIGSLQIDREPVTTARRGQDVGLEVMRDVRPGDTVTVIRGKT